MSDVKFTPGVWFTKGDGIVRVKRQDGIISNPPLKLGSGWRENVWCDKDADKEVKANAHLIAAAPELYEALEAMLRRHAGALQNWTQAAVDAQQSGNRELSVTIQNTVLTALSGFPVEEVKAALAKARGEQA